MASSYYAPCAELTRCNELIETYFKTQQYERCFAGHLQLAEQGYPLAECQVGYFYLEGLGVEKDPERALFWMRRAAVHGDWDGQYNLACFYDEGLIVLRDAEQAHFWYRKAARQGHELARERCNALAISLQPPAFGREALRGRVFPLGSLEAFENYKYVVVCSRYRGKWLLSRHKKRDTWETQGGHIEPGETPLAAARRELFEESGVREAELLPACDYWGFDPLSSSSGVVFLARVQTPGTMPESEMRETRLFDALPSALTYPHATPVFCEAAARLLRENSNRECLL